VPKVVGAFKRRYPKVHLTIKQGSPPQLAEMVIAREADMAIATEALDSYPSSSRCRASNGTIAWWCRQSTPLAKEAAADARHACALPDRDLRPAFAGGATSTKRSGRKGSRPDIVLSAVDSDVIKTYVELGLGSASSLRWLSTKKRDRHLRALDAGTCSVP